MINEGDKAPAINVTASDGSSVDLASPGQPLVVYL
jgi:peroxiredoxin Q/BCP